MLFATEQAQGRKSFGEASPASDTGSSPLLAEQVWEDDGSSPLLLLYLAEIFDRRFVSHRSMRSRNFCDSMSFIPPKTPRCLTCATLRPLRLLPTSQPHEHSVFPGRSVHREPCDCDCLARLAIRCGRSGGGGSVAAMLVGWWTPRGPMTIAQVLAAMDLVTLLTRAAALFFRA